MAARAASWFSGHLGRRGPFLAIMGAGEVCWGVGMLVEPPPTAGLHLLTAIAPLHCWASVWILAGGVTFVSGWWPFGRDGWGFVAASGPPALWAFAYAWGWTVDGYARGLWIFAWYMTTHCGVIWCASRVPPEPAVVEGRPA